MTDETEPQCLGRERAPTRILVGAHRGAMGYAPENTLAAFELAVRQGTHRIDLDVRRSRDGHVVAMHDATVDRTTDDLDFDASYALFRELAEMGADEISCGRPDWIGRIIAAYEPERAGG